MGNNDTLLIQQYFEGKLNEQEKKAFNQKLDDANFREEVAFQKALLAVVEEEGEVFDAKILEGINLDYKDESLKKELKSKAHQLATTSSIKPPQTDKIIPLRRILSIAAGVAILFFVGLGYINMNYSTDVLAKNNVINPDVPGKLSSSSNSNQIFQEGLIALVKDENSKEAISKFQSISSDNDKYKEAQYFLAHAFFKEGDYRNAINLFEQVLSTNSLPLYINKDKIEWDLLLSKMAVGEDINAELDKIIQEGKSPYAIKAEQLKPQLNSFWRMFVF